MNIKNNTDQLSRFWFLASNVLPPVGFFLYLRHRQAYPEKAKKALQSAIIGVPIAILGACIINTFIFN